LKKGKTMIRRVTPLTAPWYMRPVAAFQNGTYDHDDAQWLACQIPNHWQHHPLLTHYVGRMVYRTSFPAPATAPHRRHWLKFNGLFYMGHVWVNGQHVGQPRGYFMPHEYDITALMADTNQLVVELSCPEEHDKIGKRLITGVFSHWDSADTTLNPGGIWLPVEQIDTGPVHIQQVMLATETLAGQHAEIRYRMTYDAASACSGTVVWQFAPHNFAGKVHEVHTLVHLATGQHQASGVLTLPDPQLWWSHDMGHPSLYTVTATLLIGETASDTWQGTFGVRTFTMKNWIPYLNGKRFFMKGNNYPPTDMRIATVTQAQCEADITLAQACHMNVLRVHAHVAHPAFYAAADAMGMLVWQDFPLQWIYRRDVLPEAQRQVRQMVELLYNHPSIVLWCMHNEAVHVADTRDERLLTRLRTYLSVFVYNWNRDVLDSTLQREVAAIDATRPSVRSSGEYAIPLWHTGTDTHFYYGWYKIYGALATWEKLIETFPNNARFVTEFGAQSFPNYESAIKFMDADIRKLDVATLMRKHCFQPHMLEYWMDWQSAPDLPHLIDMTQDYHSMINRHYIDRLRLRKYAPTGGILPFMFTDANPAISWAIVDYWRVPKRVYYAMQMAFRPQYVFCVMASTRVAQGVPINLPVTVVNDAQHAVAVTIDMQLRAPDGSRMAQNHVQRTLPPDCMAMQVDELRVTPTQRGTYVLELRLTTAHDQMQQQYNIEVYGDDSITGRS
jgi:beta-mannosidase